MVFGIYREYFDCNHCRFLCRLRCSSCSCLRDRQGRYPRTHYRSFWGSWHQCVQRHDNLDCCQYPIVLLPATILRKVWNLSLPHNCVQLDLRQLLVHVGACHSQDPFEGKRLSSLAFLSVTILGNRLCRAI